MLLTTYIKMKPSSWSPAINPHISNLIDHASIPTK